MSGKRASSLFIVSGGLWVIAVMTITLPRLSSPEVGYGERVLTETWTAGHEPAVGITLDFELNTTGHWLVLSLPGGASFLAPSAPPS